MFYVPNSQVIYLQVFGMWGKLQYVGRLYINKHSALLQLLTAQTHSIYVYPKVREASRTQFLITIFLLYQSCRYLIFKMYGTF